MTAFPDEVLVNLIPTFQVAEYEQVGLSGQIFTRPEDLKLRLFYQSSPMKLRDASRFAAALSYARGTYVLVMPVEPEGEKSKECWFAGAMLNAANAPPIIQDNVVASSS
jgi:hypothetical protein